MNRDELLKNLRDGMEADSKKYDALLRAAKDDPSLGDGFDLVKHQSELGDAENLLAPEFRDDVTNFIKIFHERVFSDDPMPKAWTQAIAVILLEAADVYEVAPTEDRNKRPQAVVNALGLNKPLGKHTVHYDLLERIAALIEQGESEPRAIDQALNEAIQKGDFEDGGPTPQTVASWLTQYYRGEFQLRNTRWDR